MLKKKSTKNEFNLILSILEKKLREYDVQDREEKTDKLLKYADLLMAWNKKINLTSYQNNSDILNHLILKSVILYPIIKGCNRFIDIGTGAGIPGIPIKIIVPDAEAILIEARRKKCTFLRHICRTLEIKDIKIIQERLEFVSQEKEYHGYSDVAFVRATGKIEKVLPQIGRLLRSGGKFIYYVGERFKADNKKLDELMEKEGFQFEGFFENKISRINLVAKIGIARKCST